VLHQQLKNETASARPQCRSHGELWSAGRRARQQQTGHVRAGNQQQTCGGAQEREPCEAHLGDELRRFRKNQDSSGIVGVLLIQTSDNGAQLVLRLSQRDVRLQPGDPVEKMDTALSRHGFAVRVRRGVHRHRGPQIYPLGCDGELESNGHNAHDGRLRAIQVDGAADNAWIRTEALAPEPVAQDHCVRSARRPWCVLPGSEGAADKRRRPENVEELGADHRRADVRGLPRLGQDGVPAHEHSHSIEDVALRLPIEKIGVRDPASLLVRAKRDEPDQPLRVVKRQWSEQHRVHNAEERRRRADAQAERERRSERKARRFAQDAHGIEEICCQPRDHVA
jgi:hypothetical protein